MPRCRRAGSIMDVNKELVVDEQKIKKAIQSGIPLSVTTFTLPREIEMYVEQILAEVFKQLNQERIKDYVVYCIQELAVNAKKANTKRVYFTERGLDITNPDDYKEGMLDFKEHTLNNIDHYLERQKDLGFYIKLILQVKANIIYIEVRNNVAITKTELIRIHDKISRARQYSSLEDALAQVLDDSEGAGLGILIMILMLKKIGLDEDCFDITGTERETIARLALPLEKARLENISELSQAIVRNISSLPQFPENVLIVQKLIEDPNSRLSDIARQISTDPALTADLIKLVNSAHFMLAKKVDSITETVKMVGIQGIKNLLFSYGTQKILGNDSQEQKALWDHSYHVAFYAFNIARNFRKDCNILDDVYVGGILHDIGKIVFSNVNPELLKKMGSFCAEKGIPVSLLEDITAGMNHADIGAAIAEKWNFPANLITCIRYHHDPGAVGPEHRDLLDVVYLANMIRLLEEDEATFEQFDAGVLRRFGITAKRQVDIILEKLSAGFAAQNRNLYSK